MDFHVLSAFPSGATTVDSPYTAVKCFIFPRSYESYLEHACPPSLHPNFMPQAPLWSSTVFFFLSTDLTVTLTSSFIPPQSFPCSAFLFCVFYGLIEIWKKVVLLLLFIIQPDLFVVPQETQRLQAEPVPGIVAIPDDSNARYFHVDVAGPKEVGINISYISLWCKTNLVNFFSKTHLTSKTAILVQPLPWSSRVVGDLWICVLFK